MVSLSKIASSGVLLIGSAMNFTLAFDSGMEYHERMEVTRTYDKDKLIREDHTIYETETGKIIPDPYVPLIFSTFEIAFGLVLLGMGYSSFNSKNK